MGQNPGFVPFLHQTNHAAVNAAGVAQPAVGPVQAAVAAAGALGGNVDVQGGYAQNDQRGIGDVFQVDMPFLTVVAAIDAVQQPVAVFGVQGIVYIVMGLKTAAADAGGYRHQQVPGLGIVQPAHQGDGFVHNALLQTAPAVVYQTDGVVFVVIKQQQLTVWSVEQ